MVTKLKIRWWIYGLIAFAVVIALSIPLQIYTEFGIGDHQEAASAAQVNQIQSAWAAGGVFGLGLVSMLADLIFIGIYSAGALMAGRSMVDVGSSFVRLLGFVACICAVIFCIADYTETILQVVQMVQNAGSDALADIASTARPIKMASFIISFFAVLAGVILHRLGKRNA
ncbi:MAG: hypothetical protein ABJP34_07810 [Erythrobacter sp.]